MSLSKAYKTDKKKEVAGIPVPIFAARNTDGTVPTFYVRRLGPKNAEWQALMAKLWRPFAKQVQMSGVESVSIADRDEMAVTGMAQCGLVGWENVQNDAGEKMTFSAENAASLMTMFPELREDLEAVAFDRTSFAPDVIEATEKN
jgi:hypothetical protein